MKVTNMRMSGPSQYMGVRKKIVKESEDADTKNNDDT